MQNTIAEIVVGLPVEGPFDYVIPDDWRGRLALGQRVAVVFAHVKRLGIVVGLKSFSTIKEVKPISDVLEEKPWFDRSMLVLAKKICERYGCSMGEAFEIMLPKALRSTRSLKIISSTESRLCSKSERLLVYSQNTKDHWLLIQTKIKDTLAQGMGVIVLVADSAQIPYVVDQLKSVLPENIIIHDNERTIKQELDGWLKLKASQARVIVGLRSAVFAPVTSLGLIVMYDEGNASFQEEQSPFYQTREVMMMRADAQECSVIIVAFAATIEMVNSAQQHGWKVLQLLDEKKPRRQLIDMTNFESKGPMMISYPMRNNLEKALGKGEKVAVILNRRGHSIVTRCLFCGHVMRCPRCSTNLSFSSVNKKLECRRCSTSQELPKVCPHCSKEYLRSLGVGVERVVQEIRRLFPLARIQRFDRDVNVFPSNFDILVTTQAVLRMLGKVFVHTVGVLNVDAEFNRADYRSSQKTFSLLTHLSLMAKDLITIQTLNVDNEILRYFVAGNDKEFYQHELGLRSELGLPPYRHWIAILLRGKEEKIVSAQAQALYNFMTEYKPSGVDVLSVKQDGIAKLRDQYRFVVFVRGQEALETHAFVKNSIGKMKKKNSVIVTVQVDP